MHLRIVRFVLCVWPILILGAMGSKHPVPGDQLQLSNIAAAKSNVRWTTHRHTCFWWWGKPEYPEKTHTSMGRTCNLHTAPAENRTQDLPAERQQCYPLIHHAACWDMTAIQSECFFSFILGEMRLHSSMHCSLVKTFSGCPPQCQLGSTQACRQ